METGRTADPAGQDWRWQAHGDHAGGGERPHVRSVDRLSVARDPERPAAEKLGLRLLRSVDTYDGTLERIHHALYEQCRERAQREASPTAAIIDSQSVKSAEKGGRALIRTGTMRVRRSRARSGTFLSTH